MKLYTFPGSFRGQKVLIAAQYAGVALEVVTDTDACKKLSPLGKTPVLETEDGCIFSSNAICRYIARLRNDNNLYGETLMDAGMVDAWIDFSANEIEVPALALVYPILGWMKPVATSNDFAPMALLTSALKKLDGFLVNNTYLAGRKLTLADVVVAAALALPMKLVLDAKARKVCPAVVRWFQTVTAQPEFQAVLGEVALCEKSLAAAAAKKPAAKKDAKKKEEAKPAAAPAAAAPAKKKAKHPLELLPKSPLVMDAWKVKYSNSNDLLNDAMPWLWQNLDQQGYSLWFAKYNYNSDNTVAFMTSNLVTGFMQRCDEVRKYAFGVMQVFSEKEGAGPYVVEGAWLFRGDSEKYMLEANPDAEYYTWTKMDPSDEAQKAQVAEFFCAENTIRNMPIMDCKVFK